MDGNPRPATWPPSQWRKVAPTVSHIRGEGWPVDACCMTCGLQIRADLARIERERGADFVLWGRAAPCRKLHCDGRTIFILSPPRADGPVPML